MGINSMGSRCRQRHLEADALDGTRGVCLHVFVSVLQQAHQGTQAPALQHLWECQGFDSATGVWQMLA